jgi:SAM-dependent methyltransferase
MLWGPDDWDAWGEEQTSSTSPPADHEEVIHDILRKLPRRRRKTVGDLGCGRGWLLPFLVANFGHVLAVDYAPASLAVARRSCEGLSITFRRRDLRDLTPFRGSLDVAVAIDSIVGPRVGDVDKIVGQVLQCLVEGGLFLATFPAQPRNGPRRMLELASEEATEGPQLRFTEVELQYRLRRAGFRGVRLRRFAGPESRPERLLCVASRRASN